MKPLEYSRERYAFERITDALKHVSQVPRGKDCNCYCTVCDIDLEACQGEDNTWYFRHSIKSPNCMGWGETVLHQRAKEVLKNGSSIMTEVRGEITYSEPVLEQSIMNEIRPDVTAQHKGTPIYFEVAVHHPIEEKKMMILRGRGLRFVEINLAPWIGVELTDEELEYAVLKDVENKKVFWGDQFVEEVNANLDGNSWMSNVKSAVITLLVAFASWLIWDWVKSKENQVRGKRKKFK